MFHHILKFNKFHDTRGRFASGGLNNADFTEHDRKIIDLKPDRRPLTHPDQVRTLGSFIPGAKYVPYTKLPFYSTLMHMQGMDMNHHTGQEQKAARDVLLSRQPIEQVDIRNLVFTQNVVNWEATKHFKDAHPKPVQVARYDGKLYLLDGHHRVAYEAAYGHHNMLDAHVLDLKKVHKWATILKFNPNHDPKDGRFTSGQNSGQGLEFVSPNIEEGLNVSTAESAWGSQRHVEVVRAADEIDQMLGLSSKHTSAVGAWSDGAENTVLSRIYGNPTYEQIKLSAAMKGMLADQKAVIPFKVDRNGKDSMYQIKMQATDLNKIHEELISAGLEFHTMVPHNGHTDVYVFDPGTELQQKVEEAGAKHGAISQWRGNGEFLGSWSDRQEGRDAYQAVIDKNLGPNQRGQWDRIHSGWRRTHPVSKPTTSQS